MSQLKLSVRLGMVGLGAWGRFVARNFANTPRCELAYICDSDPDILLQQNKRYRQAQATGCFETILRDKSVDAIALATPAPFHYEMTKNALLAGKHVFVEKPMTLNSAHAEELIALAERADRKLMVGHLLEYHPAVEMMKQKIDEGALGQVYYIYCQRLNLGVVRSTENAFWSLAPHDLSVILYLFGCEPNQIETTGQCFLQEGIEDVVFSTLHFPDGRMANIHVSWLDPHKKRSMVLVGSEKMMVFDDMEPAEKIRIFDKSATFDTESIGDINPFTVRHGDIVVPKISSQEPLALETEHFIDCILHDRQPRSDGRDGLRVVRLLEQVERKLRRTPAQPIRISA